MARPKQEVLGAAQTESAAERFVLAKNHGLLVAGRTSQFYPAGTEFDPKTDSNLITRLVQSGAIFE